uniref:Retrovirus-related Pol polyprotein from transposon TNT 1-94-like beta-barrel domain-containing protein n=1 Tax=Tanacetum cinerariifolium TaxID=118510 RepID=A0A6L2LI11_TANCI|nr:hypothetical protein [Tanacetum cinerariifolium]
MSDNKDCSVESLVVVEKKTVVPTIAKVEANCNYHQKKRVVTRNNYTRVHFNNSTRKTHPSAHKNMAPRAVLMKTGLRPINTASPVNTAQPKTTIYNASPMPREVNIVRPGAVKTARPNSAVVNDVRANQVNTVKALACWVWRPTKPNGASITLKRHNYIDGHPQKVQEDQGYVDSGCSRHMTGNMSYLSNFMEFDRGYVTFGGGANGGKITWKYFSGKVIPLFETMMVQPQEDMGEDSEIPTDSYHTPTVNQPSTSSPPQKKQKSKKSKKRSLSILDDEEVVAKKEVSTTDLVPTADEVATNVGVDVSDAAITSQISIDEITLAKALIDIKYSKPKANGILMQEPSETPTPTPINSSQQPSKAKDKAKATMIEPEKHLKRKDQIMIDEEVSRN